MGSSSVSHSHEGDPKSALLGLKYGGLLIKSAASRYKRREVNAKKSADESPFVGGTSIFPGYYIVIIMLYFLLCIRWDCLLVEVLC